MRIKRSGVKKNVCGGGNGNLEGKTEAVEKKSLIW